MDLVLVLVLGLLVHAGGATDPEIEDEELRARDFLQFLNKKNEESSNRLVLAEWAYASNITEQNLQNKLAVSAEVAKEHKKDWEEVTKFNWNTFSDPDLKRQFKKYSKLGSDALPEAKLNRYQKIISEMEKIYSTAKICDFHNSSKCDLSLEPHLTQILATSRNEEELRHVWVEWRNAVGPHCKVLFEEYVDLANEAARLNNFTNNAENWLDNYEDAQFRGQIEGLWEQLKPLYLQIHAYVRFKLREKYGEVVSEKGPIPAHLLGNMWAQKWRTVSEFTLPYPDKKDEDITSELKKQNYTAVKIFQTAEDFFKSINLTEMPETFWERSILTKPNDREIVCHASAWDFYDRKDFRIKQCTQITLEHFITAHHEMGHVEYFIQYKNQPIPFREGANSGFHEAVGDLIALSVESRKHLRKLGLLKSEKDDPENVLNNLFQIGLDKIVFLPFGYLMDLWRWDVFEGKITPDEYNCKWWELREKYQGVEPPLNRSEGDFDPAAKYHIVASVPYIRYFVSFVVQFQFHKALCEKAGQYDPNDPSKPLHECDIYQSTEAGNALKKMLQLGSSKPWHEAMELLTGHKTMDASAILEYFKPLQKWLENENQKNGAFIGWEKSTKVCVNSQKGEKPKSK
ncbi:angiotensin-converting enzyme-like [Tribolium castaneum]|uniref:angiotensin-converting enzyme-like n=1 Tax=Tribolium castaneum TaxID=7070 RepID=UPI0030FEBD9A